MVFKNVLWNVIINPGAFSGKSLQSWAKVKNVLRTYHVSFCEFDSPTIARCHEIVSQLVKNGEERIMVVGGDGTLNQVINALLSAGSPINNIKLAVIPAGTGNDWARTHNIPNRPEKIMHMLTKGHFFEHDIGKITRKDVHTGNSYYFINMAGLGFDPEVIRRIQRTKQKRYASKLIYLKNLLMTLSAYKPVFCKLTFDDHSVETPLFTMAVGICKYNGNGMKQVPMAIPDNGLFDVVYIQPLTVWEIMSKLPLLYSGKHINYKKVHHVRTKTITIQPKGKLYAEIEGELLDEGTFELTCIEKKIKVLLPPPAG